MSGRIGLVLLAVLAATLAVFPWVGDLIGERFPTSYELRLVMRAMILGIVAIGLNILVGYAGLVSLGQAALYGLGAHVAALLALKAGFAFVPALILSGGDDGCGGSHGGPQHADVARLDTLGHQPIDGAQHVAVLLGPARIASILDRRLAVVAEIQQQDAVADPMEHPGR